MSRRKLLLIHHFSLSCVTGVTVMLAEMLKLIPSFDPEIEVSYQHYGELESPTAIDFALEAAHANTSCAVGVNLQIEVQWELSLALARWCARRSIPLYNYVQDYWPHHRPAMKQLEECGVRTVGSSPFIIESLKKDNFPAGFLPMGAQIPPISSDSLSAPRIVASVGRLIQRKRFPDVVRAFCEAGLDKSAQLRLTLIRSHVFADEQDAEQLRVIKNEIAKPGIESSSIQVAMTPTVPPNYAPLSAYVCASDYEGFSMAPYEAAYCGCPPILSDIPPHKFMSNALFGEQAEDFLYPVTDTRALGQRLRDEIATGRRRLYLQENLDRIREIISTHYSVRTTARALAALCEQPDTSAHEDSLFPQVQPG